MLRFSYYRSDGGEDWRFWGRLVGPWADELRSVWRRIREHAPRAHPTVDLKGVTFIDDVGEQLLAEMQRAGAGLKNGGVVSIRRRIKHRDRGGR
jgi:hypothetical protein